MAEQSCSLELQALLTRVTVREDGDADAGNLELVERRGHIGERTPGRDVRLEVVLELGGEECVVPTRGPERGKKLLEPAHPLLRVGALATQVGVVLLLLDLPPERHELVAVERGRVGAPPLDRVHECCGGSGAMVDQRVIEIEEDVVDLRPGHAARIEA